MTPQTARNRYPKGAARREAILVIALQCFADLGYHGTSMREVARRADLSQAGLLHYFPSKEDLFLAVLRERQQIDTRDYRGDQDAVGSLIQAVRRNATIPGLVQLYMHLLDVAADSAPTRDHFEKRYDFARSLIGSHIRDAQHEGTVRADLDPAVAAQSLIAVADGMQVQWLLDDTQEMPQPIELVWRLMQNRN
ncbi:TetR/AcrR family transcriptional regulator [Kineosporia mesophila]|uniref:TetR/AcrR family transcriptional regulator n=1 Tax=Kineosporia mesophila TaxID=566012 RepID=A0ABP7AR72_9ACTN